MSDELTPREHDDMRDLVLAGAQRIRPAGSHRALIATGIAVLLVVGLIGGVATIALSLGRPHGRPAGGDPTPSATGTPTPDVIDPWPEVISAASPSPLPSGGTHMTLQPVSGLDSSLVIGTSAWLDEQGIDVASAQGYESSHSIQPWTANLKDGNGRCILIRKSVTQGGWSEIVCDADGVPAWVDREVDGAVLRFTISGDVIDVYVPPE